MALFTLSKLYFKREYFKKILEKIFTENMIFGWILEYVFILNIY